MNYPESNKLTDSELMAIEIHLKLDKRHGYTDKVTWPKWLAEKYERIVNNTNVSGVDIGSEDKMVINKVKIEDGKIVSIKVVRDINHLF